MKRIKGSLTVEAALVLPIFIMVILSLMYIMKVIYIHENIQHSLSQTANELATYSYILDKSKIIDAQQEIYRNSRTSDSENIYGQIENVYNSIKSGSSYINDEIKVDTIFVDSSTTTNLDSIDNFIKSISKIKELVENNSQKMYKSLESMLDSVDNILKNFRNTIVTSSVHEGLAVANNYIGSEIAKKILDNYISDKEYKKWYIIGGKKGMDFSYSKFMLDNADIDLVVKYRLKIPIPIPVIDSISMTQRVKLRGWVGNDSIYSINAQDQSVSSDEDKLTDDDIVYCVKNSNVYHKYLTCVNNIVIPEIYNKTKHKYKLCERCSRNVDDKTIMFVYHTPNGEVYHVDNRCTQIHSDIIQMTVKEAKAEGRHLCKNCIRTMERLESN